MNGEFYPIGAPPDPSSGIPCIAVARSVARNLTGVGAGFERIDRAGVLVGRRESTAGAVLLRIQGMMDLFTLASDLQCPEAIARAEDRIRQAISSRCPELEPIGWYHTHPGFGVFASSADRDAHSALSSLACEVLFIADPMKNQASFFYLRNGEMLQCPGYYIFDDPPGPGDAPDTQDSRSRSSTADMTVRTVTGPDPTSNYIVSQGIPPSRPLSDSPYAERRVRRGPTEPTGPSRPVRHLDQRSIAVITLLVAVLIGLPLIAIELRSATDAVARLASDYVHLSSQLSELGAAIQRLENSTPYRSLPVAEPVTSTDAGTGSLNRELVFVHVLPGDSIYDITRRIYGRSSQEAVRAILELNGINDPRLLRTGTVLKLVLPERASSEPEIEEGSTDER